MTPNLLALVAGVVLAAAPAAAEPARRLTFAQAVELALGGDLGIRMAREAIGGAEARVAGARAQRLPRLRADANVLVWNEALDFDLGGMMLPPGTDTTIRDRVTASATVSVVQPLSALPVLGALVAVEQDGLEASRAELDRARLDAAARAADLYLRLLQAQLVRDISRTTVTQLEAQLAAARVLEDGGVLGRVDVLRLESARDGARQAVLRADAGARVAARALVLALTLPADTEIEVVDDLPAEPRPPRWGEDEAVRLAQRRPELRAAGERIEQAAGGRRIARAGYFPSVAGVASYQHNEGVGTIQPADAWYVGLTLQWDVWDWGKTGAAVDEAEHRRRQAAIAAGAILEEIRFDARRRVIDAATSFEALAVAHSARAAAEEAYRIQSVRFAEGAATTIEVLDAETEVARARTAWGVARYDYFLALAAVARAIGELPRLQP